MCEDISSKGELIETSVVIVGPWKGRGEGREVGDVLSHFKHAFPPFHRRFEAPIKRPIALMGDLARGSR